MNQLTDKEVELAARIWCRMMEIDPDQIVKHGADPNPGGSVFDVLLESSLWQRAAVRIRAHHNFNMAIEKARAG